ncbi:unnamed protein product [Spodoptera littoralis]|uniref:Uncharacterized protein n=1 Tax=Spodoptera littoralis TaxID=7109 RepID=A0A9P0HUB8_SPOLI|nr:unnamed protein product [Spodoptera littoralis]CAH1635451.1 unnamed protein product [Spodoptera littoralis]
MQQGGIVVNLFLNGCARTAFLANQRFVYVRDDTATSDCCLYQTIEFLVSSDGQLQMTRCDTLHLKIFRCISRQLQNLGCKIFKNSCRIHCCCCSNTSMTRSPIFEMSVNPSHGKLKSSSCRSGYCFGLSLTRIFTRFTASHFETCNTMTTTDSE